MQISFPQPWRADEHVKHRQAHARIGPTGELERWNNLSEAERNYENMIINHPDWRVRSNPLLDMTGSIIEQSPKYGRRCFSGCGSRRG